MGKVLNSMYYFGNSKVGFGNIKRINALGAQFTGLLDDYPNAAAAYSIRLLRAAYSGALVRIRRSSDNAEKDFYPDSNNELSLSSEDGASTSLSSWVGSDNAFIATWYDQSGNANNATQSSASTQPQIITSGALITENGKPKLVGSTGEFLNLTTEIIGNSGFVVGGRTGSLSLTPYFFGSETTNNSGLLYNFSTSGLTLFANPNLKSLGNTITTNQELSSYYTNGVNAFMSINGDSVSNVGAFTNDIYVQRLMKRRAASSDDNLNGYEQEVIIYSGDKSSEYDGIRTNINDFYSIY